MVPKHVHPKYQNVPNNSQTWRVSSNGASKNGALEPTTLAVASPVDVSTIATLPPMTADQKLKLMKQNAIACNRKSKDDIICEVKTRNAELQAQITEKELSTSNIALKKLQNEIVELRGALAEETTAREVINSRLAGKEQDVNHLEIIIDWLQKMIANKNARLWKYEDPVDGKVQQVSRLVNLEEIRRGILQDKIEALEKEIAELKDNIIRLEGTVYHSIAENLALGLSAGPMESDEDRVVEQAAAMANANIGVNEK